MRYSSSATEYLTMGPLQTRIDTHRLYSERPEDVERAVWDAVNLAREDSLLDIGSGTGSFLARLRRLGHLVAEARRRFDESAGALREPKGFSVSVARR
jgi:hypothetical protein